MRSPGPRPRLPFPCRVASKGVDRALGTMVGGLISLSLCVRTLNVAWLAAVTFVVAFGCVIAAELLNKDYSMKVRPGPAGPVRRTPIPRRRWANHPKP